MANAVKAFGLTPKAERVKKWLTPSKSERVKR